MGDDQLVAAQMEFQARLAALHAAQTRLAELDARLRRLGIERDHFGAANDADRAAVTSQRDRVRDEASRLRTAAQEAHLRLRQLSGPGAEPDDVDLDSSASGYQQPPFAGPQ
jgi:predicted  nucleic acid-binding Zn-ribbon protein